MLSGPIARILFVAAVVVLAGNCARTQSAAHQRRSWAFDLRKTADARPPAPRRTLLKGSVHGRSESADFAVASLQASGLRFGTDGSVAALWGYLRTAQPAVPPAAARPGDILFFRVAPVDAAHPASCEAPPDHAGVVSTVERDGRISFLEARDGRTRQSYVDPAQPQLRRDAEGRIHNSFLRPARISDPSGGPLFAGQMLCAIGRGPGAQPD